MKNTCGIILAGGNGTRLYPLTSVINKHLLPIYDKPMIFYPLSTLMMAGIRDIAIITRERDKELYYSLLGDGKNFGINIEYLTQDNTNGVPEAYVIGEQFISERNVTLILGDNIFVGQGLGKALEISSDAKGAQIFAFPVVNPQDYGVVTIDYNSKKILSLEEKPKDSKSNLAVPGLYFTDYRAIEFAKSLKPSLRGELEISHLLDRYLKLGELEVSVFRRGIGWMDAGSIDSLYAANELVEVLQKRQGLRFACPEEIAWRSGWISEKELSQQATRYKATDYGTYLNSLLATEK
jgi:glucose-1-phosphate thymidylyltransferase